MKGCEMSKEITIKGKTFSEETIIEALKAHTDWPEDKVLHRGDVVEISNGDLRLVVEMIGGGLKAVRLSGFVGCDVDKTESDSVTPIYTYVGRCTGFKYRGR